MAGIRRDIDLEILRDDWYVHDRYHRLRPSRGILTGARKAPYPQIHRPFGTNTRQHVVGRRDTGIWDNRYYGANLIGSSESQAFVPANASLGQGGAPSVVRGIRAFQPGAHHWLFEK